MNEAAIIYSIPHRIRMQAVSLFRAKMVSSSSLFSEFKLRIANDHYITSTRMYQHYFHALLLHFLFFFSVNSIFIFIYSNRNDVW